MELHPLPSMPQPRRSISEGEARAIVRNRQPRTVAQILDSARKEMELEDSYIAWMKGEKVPQLRHPRRRLRQWLTGRRPEPLPNSVMSSVEPVWLDAS
jgi:hypothetical protein